MKPADKHILMAVYGLGFAISLASLLIPMGRTLESIITGLVLILLLLGLSSWRFSVKAILVVVTLLALVMGLIVNTVGK